MPRSQTRNVIVHYQLTVSFSVVNTEENRFARCCNERVFFKKPQCIIAPFLGHLNCSLSAFDQHAKPRVTYSSRFSQTIR